MRVLLLALLATAAQAQPGIEESLNEMAGAAMRARVLPRTRAEAEQRGQRVRELLLRQIGALPDRQSALNPRVTGSFQRDGYRVEKLVYESQPKLYVTGNLYIPTNAVAPFPAVIGVAGHSANGKASATYQHAWIGFVKRGFVVLAIDPPGQGERLESFNPETGAPYVNIGTAEHIHNGLQILLTGHTFARYEIWDGVRAFDYLSTRNDVDPTRIAVAGNSGGGTQAAYLAALEPRLAAAVSSCYMTSWRELWNRPGPQDAEQIFPGFLRDGLDFGDFALASAPKPFLMTTAIRDFFPIDGARRTYEEIKGVYKLLDVESRAGYFEYDDPHGWSKPRREAAYQFLAKHLLNREVPVEEGAIQPEAEPLLYATATGQVRSSLGGETTQSLNAKYAETLVAKRRPLTRQMVMDRIVMQAPAKPRALAPKANIVGINMSAADIASLTEKGQTVHNIALPVSDEVRQGYSPMYQLSMKAILMGRTLLGMQLAEVLGALNGASDVHLYARGSATVLALHAAYLSPQISKLTLEGMPLSYMAFVQAKLHRNPVEIIVPGVLQDYDLPDLAAGIAPRPVTLIDTKSPVGTVVAVDTVRKLYPKAEVRYRVEGETLAQTFTKTLSGK